MLLEWMKPPLPWCDYHVHSWGNFRFKAPRPAVKCLDSSATAGITTSGKNTLLLQQCCPWTAGSLHYDEFLQFKARIHFIRSHPTLIDWDSTDHVQMRKKMSQNRVSCPARKSPQKKILKKGFFICLFIDEGKSILVSCLHGPELVSFLLLLSVLIAMLSPLKSTRKQQSEKGERLTDSKLKVREEGEDGRCGGRRRHTS